MTVSDVVELPIPNLRYDITIPFMDGRASVEGVHLHPGQAPGGTMLAKNTPLKDGPFGLVDLNIGNLLPAIEAGWQMTAIPVFSKRKPVYTYVFCNTASGIEKPKDLEGKRVASGRYVSSITVWLRGFLQDHYGVDLTKLKWVVWAADNFPVHDHGVSIETTSDPKKNMFQALIDGDVDAVMADISDGALFDRLE